MKWKNIRPYLYLLIPIKIVFSNHTLFKILNVENCCHFSHFKNHETSKNVIVSGTLRLWLKVKKLFSGQPVPIFYRYTYVHTCECVRKRDLQQIDINLLTLS